MTISHIFRVSIRGEATYWVGGEVLRIEVDIGKVL